MLTKGQFAHFETFGFLVLRQAFSPAEMKAILGAADEMWAVEVGNSVGTGENSAAISVRYMIELHPKLTALAEDDRIYGALEKMLGSGFIWAGSEGQRGRVSTTWHNDRPGKNQNKYTRIKVHLYIEPTTKETGALRVIPGSHRSPYHESLERLMNRHGETNDSANVDKDESDRVQLLPFGVEGKDIPCYAFESNPGDVIFFHQNIFHAVYGGLGEGRRYIAMKFAAKPTTDEHIQFIKAHADYVFQPHEAFLNSDSPRIRGMVDNLEALGAGV
jgi:hypothetical protein